MNSKNNRGYMSNVDELVEQTPLDLVLAHYGLPLSNFNAQEYRMKCVFNEACSESQYGNLAVKLDVAKQIFCHSCSVRGNLLTLIHGLEKRQPPAGGRVRGQEFKDAVAKLKAISAPGSSLPSKSVTLQSQGTTKTAQDPNVQATSEMGSPKPQRIKNVALHRHDKEAARAMADLYLSLIHI